MGYIIYNTTQLFRESTKPLSGSRHKPIRISCFKVTRLASRNSRIFANQSGTNHFRGSNNAKVWEILRISPYDSAVLRDFPQSFLGGVFQHVFYFHPDFWGHDAIWRSYFSDGWFNHELAMVGSWISSWGPKVRPIFRVEFLFVSGNVWIHISSILSALVFYGHYYKTVFGYVV